MSASSSLRPRTWAVPPRARYRFYDHRLAFKSGAPLCKTLHHRRQSPPGLAKLELPEALKPKIDADFEEATEGEEIRPPRKTEDDTR
jgi:hypothetical protein